MKRGWRIALQSVVAIVGIAVLIALVIGPSRREMVHYVGAFFVYGISNGGDVDECSRIREAFLQRHDIPRISKSVPGRTPVFCNPRSIGVIVKTPPTFVIYGALDKVLQDQYLATLKSIQHDVGTNDLRVEFYEQENWVEWKSSGASGGDRGPERLLRKESLAH